MPHGEIPQTGETVHFSRGDDCLAAIVTKRQAMPSMHFDLAVIDPHETPLSGQRIEMRWDVGDNDWHRIEDCPSTR